MATKNTAAAPDEAQNTAAAEQKVTIRIPVDKQNKSDLVVPVCINGRKYHIKRGETVEVPEVVADILAGAGYI